MIDEERKEMKAFSTTHIHALTVHLSGYYEPLK